MRNEIRNNEEITLLLGDFNSRETIVFGKIYSLLYKELYYFSSKIYDGTVVDPKDVIQDIFIKIWQKESLKFDNIYKLKTYLYISIRNSFRMYYQHNKMMSESADKIIYDNDLFITYTTEAEVVSIIPEALNLLPEECAKSFKLFIDGFSVKEIAEKLNKPQTTIYSQKEKAISILREKLSRDRFLFLILLFISKIE